METHLFYGTVLPERAHLSIEFSLEFSHLSSGAIGIAKISIILNQVAVWVDSEHDWDIFDLRNVVKTIVQDQLSMIGYLKGYAYDFHISRVLNQSCSVNYVFGIDIPCIEERGRSIDLNEAMAELRKKTVGENGVFINRCFSDLISSMKSADDTAFYCYRAIESLRQHCSKIHDLANAEKSEQWRKFREISGSDKQALIDIKEAADPLRHGDVTRLDAVEREKLFIGTWDVVEGYLKNI